MKKSSIPIILFLCAFALFASCDNTDPEPDDGIATWVKAYGSADADGGAKSVGQTADGGFIMLGGKNDILKLNGEGAIQWHNCFALAEDFTDLKSLAETPEGDLVVTGRNGFDAAVLLKLDSAANVLWTKRIEWGQAVNRYTLDVDRNTGSIYILGEQSGSRCVLMKKDADGNTRWVKTFGFDMQIDVNGVVSSLRATDDGGCIMIANLTHLPSGRGCLPIAIKCDAAGGIEWQKTYGPSGGTGDLVYGENWDMFLTIEKASGGGYILTGQSEWGDMAWALRIDGLGNILWGKELSSIIRSTGDLYTIDSPVAACQLDDGGYVVAGKSVYETENMYTAQSTVDQAAWIIKLSPDGALEWQKSYREEKRTWTYTGEFYTIFGFMEIEMHRTENRMNMVAFAPVSGGGFIGAGSTSLYGAGGSDFMVLKLNSSAGIIEDTALAMSTRKAAVKNLSFTVTDRSVYQQDTVTETYDIPDPDITDVAFTATDF